MDRGSTQRWTWSVASPGRFRHHLLLSRFRGTRRAKNHYHRSGRPCHYDDHADRSAPGRAIGAGSGWRELQCNSDIHSVPESAAINMPGAASGSHPRDCLARHMEMRLCLTLVVGVGALLATLLSAASASAEPTAPVVVAHLTGAID